VGGIWASVMLIGLCLQQTTMETLQTGPMGLVPANERQVRPLTQLETAEAQMEAWETAVETAPEGSPTVIF